MDSGSKPEFHRTPNLPAAARSLKTASSCWKFCAPAYERNLMDADALTIIEGALAASDTRVTDVMVPRPRWT
jgi:magnesium and cobalt transporter